MTNRRGCTIEANYSHPTKQVSQISVLLASSATGVIKIMPNEKSLHVDDDWKSQVQAEQERLAKTAAPVDTSPQLEATGEPETPSQPRDKSTASTTTASPEQLPTHEAATDREPQLPPASLLFLINTLASQAVMSLGDYPNPLTGKPAKNLPTAKHFIDTLAVLEEKTTGNRTPEESNMLRHWLSQLRLAYVQEITGGK